MCESLHRCRQTWQSALRGARLSASVAVSLWVVGCGGNGSTPHPAGTEADTRANIGSAYAVPVYMQPVYPNAPQGAVVWGAQPSGPAQQPMQPYAQAQGQYPGQYPPQAQQYAPAPAPQPQSVDNPWAMQGQRQGYTSTWASSQPWSGAVQTRQQPLQQAPVAGQYRPLEGDSRQQTPPAVTPYDQVYGSSQRPLPATPYGAYTGGYPGAYPGGYGGAWGGGWPGGYPGGYPGYGGGYPGYGGGWPGGWGGMPFGGGMPGMGWPGMW